MLKIPSLAFAFLLFAAIQPTVRAQANQTQPANRSGSAQQQSPTNVGDTPVESKPVSKPSATDDATSNHHQPADNSPTITDWMQAITSVLLFAAIIVQVCIYNKQRVLMWKQWAAMRRGLRQGDRSLRVSNRAYVGIQKIGWDPLGKPPTMVLLEIGNTGNTPATAITVGIEVWTGVQGDYRTEYIKDWAHHSYGTTKLFRGNLPIVIRLEVSRHLKPEIMASILAAEGVFFTIQGKIDYNDGFASQHTDFMYTYMGRNVWTPLAPDEWTEIKKKIEAERTK